MLIYQTYKKTLNAKACYWWYKGCITCYNLQNIIFFFYKIIIKIISLNFNKNVVLISLGDNLEKNEPQKADLVQSKNDTNHHFSVANHHYKESKLLLCHQEGLFLALLP
ncbi:hypothetical protein BpHYR1_043685 [Brachionus plicatilis]|uniref:Uncharacterized protein n=1 Tax=Brachionus plicatilis TaxID=10195 RepID=A0A3M7RQH2_BRAPC|nr:hypothetical protein BpHYR1_043685 [Brachionus plicatilis]